MVIKEFHHKNTWILMSQRSGKAAQHGHLRTSLEESWDKQPMMSTAVSPVVCLAYHSPRFPIIRESGRLQVRIQTNKVILERGGVKKLL